MISMGLRLEQLATPLSKRRPTLSLCLFCPNLGADLAMVGELSSLIDIAIPS